MNRSRALAAALALGAIGAAEAQKVYRCGPDQRTYQQSPCKDGQAIDASDPRSAAQRDAAQDLAKREAAEAAKLDRELQGPPPAKRAAKPPRQSASAASSAAKKKGAAADKPLVYLVPPKPGASDAKP